MSWAHLTQTQTIKSRKSTDWSSVHAWKAAFWLLSTATLCYYSLRGILWPHPSRPGSCRVRRSAGWPTRSRRWCTRTRWPSRTAQLQKRRVLQGDLWDCGWLETAVTSQSALWAIHSGQKENVSLTYKRIITINWILHTCNTNNVVDNKGCTKEDGCGSVCGGSFLHLFPGRFFHLHPSCNLPARHTATSSRCTGCCDSETGRLSSVPHSLSAIKHSEKHQGHVQRPAAGLFPAQPPCWAETENDIIHSKTAHAEEFDTIGHNEGTQRRADKRSHERNRCSNTSRPTLLEPRSAPAATCTLWLRRRSASSICVCEHRVRTTRVVSEKSCLNVHVVYSAEHFKWSIRIQSCINAVHYKLTM